MERGWNLGKPLAAGASDRTDEEEGGRNRGDIESAPTNEEGWGGISAGRQLRECSPAGIDAPGWKLRGELASTRGYRESHRIDPKWLVAATSREGVNSKRIDIGQLALRDDANRDQLPDPPWLVDRPEDLTTAIYDKFPRMPNLTFAVVSNESNRRSRTSGRVGRGNLAARRWVDLGRGASAIVVRLSAMVSHGGAPRNRPRIAARPIKVRRRRPNGYSQVASVDFPPNDGKTRIPAAHGR